MVLEILRNNNWERPVYFAVTIGPDSYAGLQDYFRLEGLAWRLVPIKYGSRGGQPNGIGKDIMYANVMEDFQWGGMDREEEIYMDENNRRMATNLRLQLSNLAAAFVRDGVPVKGLEVVERLMLAIPSHNVPFDRIMLPAVELLSELADDTRLTLEQRTKAGSLAKQVGSEIFQTLTDDVAYFISLDDAYYAAASSEIQVAMAVSQRISGALSDALPDDEDVQAMSARLSQLRNDQTNRANGPLSDPPVFDPDAGK